MWKTDWVENAPDPIAGCCLATHIGVGEGGSSGGGSILGTGRLGKYLAHCPNKQTEGKREREKDFFFQGPCYTSMVQTVNNCC